MRDADEDQTGRSMPDPNIPLLPLTTAAAARMRQWKRLRSARQRPMGALADIVGAPE